MIRTYYKIENSKSYFNKMCVTWHNNDGNVNGTISTIVQRFKIEALAFFILCKFTASSL